ncbi:MAG TPA: hypothetical protein VIG90_14155 [Pedomonas sp.]|uniref:AbiTii domain-containing protein n=1 Tax=Pedomonas sp. TaxID=2976421 RepID=UPI002F4000B3
MSILQEIQSEVLANEVLLSTILLKMRFLASRLDSELLEDWIRNECEGYPRNVEVPDYRILGVSYKGTWSGPWGGGIQNAPIPIHLIEKYAGPEWVNHKVRESIAGVEALTEDTSGELAIDASNLILILQDKVYEGLACNSVMGKISMAAMREIKHSVRSRILEFTLQLEKKFPEAVDITLHRSLVNSSERKEMVTQIFNQTVYGTVNNVTASDNSTVNFTVIKGDIDAMIGGLVKAGMPHEAAKEFAEIVASEKPQNNEQLGSKALAWISKQISKAAGGVWNITSSALTNLLTEAALKFYGLKP